jgi:hypothetical protein
MVKEMSEETKTQGIKTETTTKDIPNTTKTTSKTELLDLRAGYVQHTSPKKRREQHKLRRRQHKLSSKVP